MNSCITDHGRGGDDEEIETEQGNNRWQMPPKILKIYLKKWKTDLKPLHAADTNPDVRRLDHRHIICPVTNGHHCFVAQGFDNFNNLGFLRVIFFI